MHLHQPTRTLKKLRYQWSAPTYLVTKVFEGNTCRLLPLVSAKGRALTRPSPVVANLKMVKPSRKGKPPSGFWIGCRVLSSFGNVEYVGTVDDVETDGTQTLFHVCYEDFDEEELDLGQLQQRVIYHPALDTMEHAMTAMPEVGSFVLFALQQQPRLGQVVEIHEQDQRQLVIHLWKPQRSARDFVSAKFKPAFADEEPSLLAVTVSRVRARNLEMSESGYLQASSKKIALKVLKQWRRS